MKHLLAKAPGLSSRLPRESGQLVLELSSEAPYLACRFVADFPADPLDEPFTPIGHIVASLAGHPKSAAEERYGTEELPRGILQRRCQAASARPI